MHRHHDFDHDDNDDVDSPDVHLGPSKTQVKKALLELQDLAVALMELPEARIAKIDMDERLREALAELRRLTAHSARKRHVKYVGKLLRDADIEPFQQALAAQRGAREQDAERLHEAEAWRERLLADEASLEIWIAHHPASNTRQFRALVATARQERAAAVDAAARGKPPRKGRTYRELFRYLRDALNHAAADAG